MKATTVGKRCRICGRKVDDCNGAGAMGTPVIVWDYITKLLIRADRLYSENIRLQIQLRKLQSKHHE